VSDRINSDTRRAKVGSVGAIGSATVFTIVIIAFCLLEASFRTWTVGRFFENCAGIFVDLFLVMGVCSILTLILSCFGYGKRRGFGIALSVMVLALITFIFGTNK
jgi:hypothetical protein